MKRTRRRGETILICLAPSHSGQPNEWIAVPRGLYAEQLHITTTRASATGELKA